MRSILHKQTSDSSDHHHQPFYGCRAIYKCLLVLFIEYIVVCCSLWASEDSPTTTNKLLGYYYASATATRTIVTHSVVVVFNANRQYSRLPLLVQLLFIERHQPPILT